MPEVRQYLRTKLKGAVWVFQRLLGMEAGHLPQVFSIVSICPLESWLLQWEHLQQICHCQASDTAWNICLHSDYWLFIG